MEIGDERDERMSDVRLQRSADGTKVGVAIARPEGEMVLWFAEEGSPSAGLSDPTATAATITQRTPRAGCVSDAARDGEDPSLRSSVNANSICLQ
jgi:hypothetical protein